MKTDHLIVVCLIAVLAIIVISVIVVKKPSVEYQVVNMSITSQGYVPNALFVKRSTPVEWRINVTQLTGCNGEIVLKEYGIDKKLTVGMNTIEFTPILPGNAEFTCGMDMMRGVFIVQ